MNNWKPGISTSTEYADEFPESVNGDIAEFDTLPLNNDVFHNVRTYTHISIFANCFYHRRIMRKITSKDESFLANGIYTTYSRYLDYRLSH